MQFPPPPPKEYLADGRVARASSECGYNSTNRYPQDLSTTSTSIRSWLYLGALVHDQCRSIPYSVSCGLLSIPYANVGTMVSSPRTSRGDGDSLPRSLSGLVLLS